MTIRLLHDFSITEFNSCVHDFVINMHVLLIRCLKMRKENIAIFWHIGYISLNVLKMKWLPPYHKGHPIYEPYSSTYFFQV